MKNNTILKALIFLLFFIILIIIALILSIKREDNNEKVRTELNSIKNEISEDEIQATEGHDEEIKKESDSTNDDDLMNMNQRLKFENDVKNYFLLKACLKYYYDCKNVEDLQNIIDEEAKDIIDISSIINYIKKIENYQININEILGQKIISNKMVYLIKYKIVINNKIYDSREIVKIDKNRNTFSVYPYEFVKKKEYQDLQENDKIDLKNIEAIESNKSNEYNELEINSDEKTQIIELFEKFKFDLNYDNEHLYNTIDKEYREIYCNTVDDFKDYLNRKKDIFNNDMLNKYQVNKLNNYTQYIGICENENHYIFKAKNLMEYTILFDNYSTILPQYRELYYSNFPKVQAKYCIDRFIKAINDKNYEFAYSKLLHVQKNNYYPQLDDFENEVKNEFFEKNSYDFENVIEISENVYQYTITLTDKQNENKESKTIIATVTLKNNADFDIAFKIK